MESYLANRNEQIKKWEEEWKDRFVWEGWKDRWGMGKQNDKVDQNNGNATDTDRSDKTHERWTGSVQGGNMKIKEWK